MDVKQMQIADWYYLFAHEPGSLDHVETIVEQIKADEPISSSDYECLAAFAVMQLERRAA